jgi:hypothetical protein
MTLTTNTHQTEITIIAHIVMRSCAFKIKLIFLFRIFSKTLFKTSSKILFWHTIRDRTSAMGSTSLALITILLEAAIICPIKTNLMTISTEIMLTISQPETSPSELSLNSSTGPSQNINSPKIII